MPQKAKLRLRSSAACSLDDAEAIVEDGVVKGAMRGVERVGQFRRFVLREDALLAPIAPDDVGASALHEVARQTDAQALVFERRRQQRRIEQAEQPVERLLIAAVRRGRQQHHVARTVLGQELQQLEALLPAACVPTQACASSTTTNAGQARAKLSRRRSLLM